MSLPTHSTRPSFGWYVANALGRGGCLTHAFLPNLARLVSYGWLLASLWETLFARLATPALPIPWLRLGLSAAACVAAWRWRPRPPADTFWVPRWSPAEQRLARAATAARREGQSLLETIQAAGNPEALAVDYGCVAATRRPVAIHPSVRQAHQLVTGGSGTGKSKFLATQAAQSALLGATIGMVDPHEELVSDLLMSSADVLAERGCVILWPEGPSQRILPWNPLQTSAIRPAWQAADLVVAAVKRVWGLSDANTFIIDVLKHTCWALAAAGWTLLEGPRFLTDADFRLWVADEGDVPEVQDWVAAFNAKPPRDREGLITTTLVRLNRLRANPHLARLVGAGATNPLYRAALRTAGIAPVEAIDLTALINRGHHLLAVVPKRVFQEDQFVVAGLIQSAILTAVLDRRPNDPAMPAIDLYLDEAAAYATGAGLGTLLAQARKYKVSAFVAMQGIHQAEEDLQAELKTNTAIKTIFGTDHEQEAAQAARMLWPYRPEAVKTDSREKVSTEHGTREQGQLQFYSPTEQYAYYAGQIMTLPPRQYVLKARGSGIDPLVCRTPDYRPRFHDLMTAFQTATRLAITPSIGAAPLDAELAFRQRWLATSGVYRSDAPGMDAVDVQEATAPPPPPTTPAAPPMDDPAPIVSPVDDPAPIVPHKAWRNDGAGFWACDSNADTYRDGSDDPAPIGPDCPEEDA